MITEAHDFIQVVKRDEKDWLSALLKIGAEKGPGLMDQIGWKILKFVTISKLIDIMADKLSKLLDAAANSLIRLAFKQWPLLKLLSPPDEPRTRSGNGRHSNRDPKTGRFV